MTNNKRCLMFLIGAALSWVVYSIGATALIYLIGVFIGLFAALDYTNELNSKVTEGNDIRLIWLDGPEEAEKAEKFGEIVKFSERLGKYYYVEEVANKRK